MPISATGLPVVTAMCQYVTTKHWFNSNPLRGFKKIMNQLVTDKAKFLQLATQGKIESALKTFSDTILFYYLGHLALTNDSEGNISEIGVGGSTYPLIELAQLHNKTFYAIDKVQKGLDQCVNTSFWPKAKVEKICVNSKNLDRYHVNKTSFSYSHVDGDKNYNTTLTDIKFYLDNLSINGLICQDDYGNHKWPTVTDAVKELEFQQKIKIIFVGDSSVWFTKPEYYNYWFNLLEQDYEFALLKAVCNICSSLHLGKTPPYFFMQRLFNFGQPDDYTETQLEYFNTLNVLFCSSNNYLKMPYLSQSTFADFLNTGKKTEEYLLLKIWDHIKGDDWPQRPTTKEEIQQLPDWVKNELEQQHKIDDIYKRIP